jgi:hypothetical protein
MSIRDIAGKGTAGRRRSGDRAGDRPLLGRKSVLMGMLTSGFVIANAAQPSAVAAGTIKSIAATQPAYVSKWTPATAYAYGQQVISPNNDVVSAKLAHTSSATFAVDQVKWILSSTYARGGSQVFSQGGSATTGSSGAWAAPFSLTITRVVLSCTGAAAGSDLVVAFKHGGTTLSTLTIAAGSTTSVTATVTVSITDLEKLTVTATSVGSTTAATDVVAQMDWVKA